MPARLSKPQAEGPAAPLLGAVRPRVAALDGIRGIAILAVIGFHAPYGARALDESWFKGGFLGVDVFMVLSGFLITLVLLPPDRQPGFGAFWGRRLLRLGPGLLGLVVVSGLLGALALDAAERSDLLAQLPAAATALINWYSGAGDPKDATFVSHTWSLALEWQWYLLWSTFVLLVGRQMPRLALLWTAAAVALATCAWRAISYADGVDIERIYFGLDTRMDTFMVGAVVALAMQTYGVPSSVRARRAAEVAGVLALGLLVALVATQSVIETFWYSNGGFLVVGLGSAALVVRAASGGRGPVLALLELPPLAALGRISYSVYLWHWPVFILTDPTRTGLSFATTLLIRMPLTLAVSVASYRVLERPFLHRRRPPAPAGVSPTRPDRQAIRRAVADEEPPDGRTPPAEIGLRSTNGRRRPWAG